MLKELPSTDNSSPTADHCCGGCGRSIRDRFYLLAADRSWHGSCLRCFRCSQPLDSELSCFARDGNIYCKEDYYRLFSSRRCARCGTGLSSSELVMRARDLVFHVGCFCCILCGQHLSAGDTAAVRGGRVFCSEHYDADVLSESNSLSPPFFTGTNGTAQKGRPRKRKLMINHHQNDPLNLGTAMQMDLMHADLQATSLDLNYDGSQSPGSGGSLTQQTRNKRMRTSFKHHQLRTMKSYFAINQNPDAKDLKQLSQKTGLSKRVLQVWFQNARAKWRRNSMRHDGNQTGNPTSGTPLTPLTIGGPPSVQSTSSSNIDTSGMTPSHALEEMHHLTFSELY
ncbi:LIM/homeobox protein Lhx9-like [Sitodiplosis mosellana]|uniref:LIM/homeobox protein Lhx9-like n=1 Tax=Sitodiplosis mosellana TaxID=263140 RepID=UPI0024450CCD|nr:LIM/homeobox protein Lhx9-like [Sitodiplosis mosellana]